MLQPFLENSIWHGILPTNKEGKVEVSIFQNGDTLSIQIIDNGIGYKVSLNNKKEQIKTHNSQGMSITKNRISLYQRMTGNSYDIIGPTQLEDENGTVLGTRVEIRIPNESNKSKTSIKSKRLELS